MSLSPYAKNLSKYITGPYGKRTYSYVRPEAAAKARSMRSYVPRPIYSNYGSEQKFFDTLLSGTIDATGEVAPGGGTSTGLCLIPQGVTESTRVGRKCVIKSINMRGSLVLSNTIPSDHFNIAIVLDTQANGAYPSYTDVFETDTPLSHLNLANSQRFRILKRWVMSLEANTYNSGAGTYSNPRRIIKFYKRCNIPLEFSSTTGAITEIRSNNIFVMWSSNTAGDDLTTADLNFRLRFED